MKFIKRLQEKLVGKPSYMGRRNDLAPYVEVDKQAIDLRVHQLRLEVLSMGVSASRIFEAELRPIVEDIAKTELQQERALAQVKYSGEKIKTSHDVCVRYQSELRSSRLLLVRPLQLPVLNWCLSGWIAFVNGANWTAGLYSWGLAPIEAYALGYLFSVVLYFGGGWAMTQAFWQAELTELIEPRRRKKANTRARLVAGTFVLASLSGLFFVNEAIPGIDLTLSVAHSIGWGAFLFLTSLLQVLVSIFPTHRYRPIAREQMAELDSEAVRQGGRKVVISRLRMRFAALQRAINASKMDAKFQESLQHDLYRFASVEEGRAIRLYEELRALLP
jgi:hypothetical protein